MILDRYNEFSSAEAHTTVAAHDSDSIVDLGAATLLKFGAQARPIRFHALVSVAVTTGTTSTIQVKLLTDSTSAFGSAVTLYDSGAVSTASAALAVGYRFTGDSGFFLPPSLVERFLKVTYTIGTAVLTAGAFDAFLSNDGDSNEF